MSRAAGEGRPVRPDVAHVGTGRGVRRRLAGGEFAVFGRRYKKHGSAR